MRFLVIAGGEQPERRFGILDTCSVGSGAEDVQVAGLPTRAFVVSPVPEGIVLEPTTPIVVGGRTVPAGARRLLRFGERADLGGRSLHLEGFAATASAATRVLAGAILAGVAPPPATGPSMLVLEGPAAGGRFAIRSGMVMGRGHGVDAALGDPLVSRRHCRIDVNGATVTVEDLGSKNGLAVNGRAVGRHEVPLRAGDEITMGATRLRYEAAHDGDGTPPPGMNDGAPAGQPVAVTPGAGDGAVAGAERTSRARIAAVAFASSALLALAAVLARAAG